MNPEIKVIDNFLGIDEYKEMQKMLLAQSEKYHNFRWLFLESTVDYSHRPEVNMQTCDELDNFQFSHVFYYYRHPVSDFAPHVLYDALHVEGIIKCKANLTTRGNKISEYGYHQDVDFPCKTAVWYLNTCDGYTIFDDGTKVDSVANRVVIFPSHFRHTGTNTTNSKYRIVVNVNYQSSFEL